MAQQKPNGLSDHITKQRIYYGMAMCYVLVAITEIGPAIYMALAVLYVVLARHI